MKNWQKKSLVAVVALFCCILLLGNSRAQTKQAIAIAGDDQKVINKTVDKIAASVKAGKKVDVKKMAEKLAGEQEEVYYVMLAFKPRNKKGFGIGKPGELQPDGIEKYVQQLAKVGIAPAVLKKHNNALSEMAYRLAAVAEFADEQKVIPTKRPKGKKSIANWKRYAGDMRKASRELIKAIREGKAADVQKIAIRLDSSCNRCHSEFR